jgi:Transport and Golgi organisation 2
MCTVTYVPTKHGYLLGSNRDEQATRATAISPIRDVNLLYPKDADKGGTWLSLINNGDCLCLLNGAFVKHIPNEKYTYSRGLLVLDVARSDNKIEFITQVDLAQVEPFTLVIKEAQFLFQIKWDGSAKHIVQLDSDVSYVWSSCTLYDEQVKALRENWFEEFLQNGIYTAKDLLQFHQQAGNGIASQNVLMQREGGSTVSTSIIEVSAQSASLNYIDYKLGTQQTQQLQIA